MLRKAALSIAENPLQAHELSNTILGDLYLPSGVAEGTEPKIAQYDGIGSLEGWLRIILSRMVIDRHRSNRKQVPLEELGEEPAAVPGESGPEHLVVEEERRKAARLFKEAFSTAMSQLDAQQKLVLRLYYLENVNLKQIGFLLNAHESTASRLLEKLKKRLRRQVEKYLREKGQVQPQEIWFYLEAGSSATSLELQRTLNMEKRLER
jgi:RNA polymerase sigma-70 factor (ECF subfamily)